MAVFPYLFVTSTTEQLVLQYAALLSKLHLQSAATAAADPEDTPEYIRAKEALESSASSSSRLLHALVQDYASEAALLLSLPDVQVEGLFSLLLAVIQKVAAAHDKKLESTLIQAVLKSLEHASQERGAMKLRLIHHLFNTLPASSPLRRATFDTLVKLAQRHGELKALGTQLVHLPVWVREWGLRPETDALAFYSNLSDVFEASGLVPEAYTCLLLLLPMLRGKHPCEFEAVFTRAVCLGMLRPHHPGAAPVVVDLSALLPMSLELPLPSLQARLALQPYVTGDLLNLRATLPALLRAAAAEMSPSAILSEAQVLDNARLIHLSRLPAGLRLSYRALAQPLMCARTDVERYVTDAIARGLLVAKLHPIDQTVTVVQSRPLYFHTHDWTFLQTSLAQWQKKLGRAKSKVLEIGQETFHGQSDDEDEEEEDDDEEERNDVAEQEEDNNDDNNEEEEEIKHEM